MTITLEIPAQHEDAIKAAYARTYGEESIENILLRSVFQTLEAYNIDVAVEQARLEASQYNETIKPEIVPPKEEVNESSDEETPEETN